MSQPFFTRLFYAPSLSLLADEWQTITLSFDTEPSKRDAWLDALCSAISNEFVGPGLHHHHLPPLASEFNSRFGQQRGVGSRRSLLSGKAPITAPLTPRGQPPRRSTASSSTASLTYEIVVPTGAVPGDKLKMQLPSGEEVVVMVPPEATSGSVLTFAMPNAISGGTHDDKGAEENDRANDVDAAILIQAAVRGKLARRRASAAPFAPEQAAVTRDNKLASPGIRMRCPALHAARRPLLSAWLARLGFPLNDPIALTTRALPLALCTLVCA